MNGRPGVTYGFGTYVTGGGIAGTGGTHWQEVWRGIGGSHGLLGTDMFGGVMFCVDSFMK